MGEANSKIKEESLKMITSTCLKAWEKLNLKMAVTHFNQLNR